MSRVYWDDSKLDLLKKQLSRSETMQEACRRLEIMGLELTPNAVKVACKRHLGRPPIEFLGKALVAGDEVPKVSHGILRAVEPNKFDALVKAAKQSPSFVDLCDKLNLSPKSTKELIYNAQLEGYAIKVGEHNVSIGHHDNNDAQETEIPPTVGGWFKLGVLSDIHAGSKYCLRKQTSDCVSRMYNAGARNIVINGDLLDGCYRHGEFELKYSGIEEQTADLFRILPNLDGLRYHAITGNHDFTFSEKTGLDVGAYITGHFKNNGRNDIKFYGDRAATLRIGGTTVRLLHPTGSCSYAVSYKLAKFVEAFDSAEKPGVLLVGHWHRSCYLYTRAVHAIACPTFQGPGSAFGKSLGLGPQAIGGLMLSWKLTKYKTLREFNIRPMNYFKREQEKETE